MRLQHFAVIVLLAAAGFAKAEGGCPPGQYPSNPTPQGGVMACYPLPSGTGAQQPSGPAWSTNWGAIVVDASQSSAGIGTATGYSSKRKANKAAIADCEAKGGTNCEVRLSFFNQCAVVVAGVNYNAQHSAATLEEATNTGMKDCQSSGVESCQVYWSGCSLPERVR